MMVPNLVSTGSGGNGGASAGALVRKRILTVDGGRPFVRITESMGSVDLAEILLSKVAAEYDGPLTLRKDIVNFRCAMIGGGGGGDTSDGSRTAWGGWPGGVYHFDGRLSDMPAAFYVFVGSGGLGAYIPDPENADWETGDAQQGSDSQFYGFAEYTWNNPRGAGGFSGGNYDRSDSGQQAAWLESMTFNDARLPDPLLLTYQTSWGNNAGPGPGAPMKAEGGFLGGHAYASDPLRMVQPQFGGELDGRDAGDVFAACGSGGSSSSSGNAKGGNGGTPGGGGGGAFGGLNGGDGAPGEIHIELSLWEIA